MKYCPYCGKELPVHDYKFCPECGARLVHTPGVGEPASADKELYNRPLYKLNEPPRPEANAGRVILNEIVAERDDTPTYHAVNDESVEQADVDDEYTVQETHDGIEHEMVDIVAEAAEEASTETENIDDVIVQDTFEEMLRTAPHNAYRDFALPQPVPDPTAPHDAYREFAPAVMVREPELSSIEVAEYAEADTYEMAAQEQEIWLRPDGWTPENDEQSEQVGTKPQPEGVHNPHRTRVRRKFSMVRVWAAFLVAILIIGGIAGFAVLKIRQKNAAQTAADRFAQSVYTGDTKQVLTVLETAGSGLSSTEDVAAMCAAIKETVPQHDFRNHLLAFSNPTAQGYNEALSSITLREKKNNLFVQKYAATISAVPVLVRTDIAGAAIYVDGVRRETVPADDGGLLLHIAPGKHKLRAVYEDYGKEYELGSAQMNSLSSTKPQELALSQNAATLEIELAGVETNLVVKVDGRIVHPPQTGGWLVISPAFVGMEIELTCAEYSQYIDVTMAGKQSVPVEYIEIMQQQNPGGKNSDPNMLTNRQLADKLGKRFYTCYRSYLDASNSENELLIRDADEEYRAALTRNIQEYNSDYLFEFKSMQVDYRSVSRRMEDDKLLAHVRVEVLYNYSKRTETPNWLAGFNRQDVTLRFDEEIGDWMVHGSRVDDALTLTEDTFTIT